MVGDTQVLVGAESVQIAGLRVGETVALAPAIRTTSAPTSMAPAFPSRGPAWHPSA